jgi:RNA polymerase sigma-70 factor (ECF subfamily)
MESDSRLKSSRDVPEESCVTGRPEARVEVARRLEAARAGSNAAIGELFENCRNYLLLVANGAVGEGLQARVAASDLVQETFLEAGKIFGRFTGNSEEELLRWLTRILENKLGNAVKRHAWAARRDVNREVPLGHADDSDGNGLSLADPATPPSRVAAAGEEHARLRAAIAQLPEEYRQVIELRIDRSLSFEEVGRLMDRTGEAARKLFARAIDQLQSRFASHDSGTAET